MLSLHTKRKRTLFALASIAIILPAISLVAGIIIKNTNAFSVSGFTDSAFYDCVLNDFRAEWPDEEIPSSGLTDDQLSRLKWFGCNTIRDVNGLEKLTGLLSFTINGPTNYQENISDDITYIDFSHNPSLTEIHLAEFKNLESVDISNNSALKNLLVSSRALFSIDSSHNTNLEHFQIYDLGVPLSIDLSHNINLTRFSLSTGWGVDFGDSPISIDLSNNVNLEQVYVAAGSNIESVILPNSNKLTELHLSCPFPTIDLSRYVNLKYLSIGGKNLASIDLSHNTALESLSFGGSDDAVTRLDVSKNTNLTNLSVYSPNISYLDISNLYNLEYFKSSGNTIVYANVPNATNNNTTYDLSGLKFIRGIDNTDNYTYDSNSKQLTITNAVDFDGEIKIHENQAGVGGSGPVGTMSLYSPYILSFVDNNGKEVIEPQACHRTIPDGGCNLIISSEQPSREGYTFLGWANAGANDVQYLSGARLLLSGNKTLYAVWGITLSLYMDDGTEDFMDLQCHTLGDSCSVTLPDTPPTREGYYFLGWVDLFGLTPTKQPGESMVLNGGDSGLHASWAPIRKLHFELNGGTWSGTDRECHGDTASTIAQCITYIPNTDPTKNGFGFLGWATEANSDTVVYHRGEAVVIDSDITLYAVWSETKTFTVTFDLNGGSGNIESVSCTTHESNCVIAVPDTVPTRDGYGFAGWAYDRNAEQADYGPGARFAISKDETVYALWTQEEHVFAIFFDSNTVDSDTESVICNTMELYCRVAPPDSLTIREGYTFLGWASTPDATAVEYLPGENIPTSSTLIDRKMMYAIWREDVEPEDPTPRVYHLLFANLDGDGRVNLDIPGYDCTLNGDSDTCTVQIEDEHFGYTLDGYYLLGFADTKNATTATYKLSGNKSVTLDSNEKFIYAVWAPVYTLTLDLHGGAGNIETSKTCHPNSINGDCDVIIPSDSPTKDGHSFLGYADAADSTTATYEAGGNLSLSSNKIIYAIWKKKSTPDDPTPDDPTPDDPTPDDPTPDDPTPDDPTPDDPTPDDPTPDDPTPDDPTPDDPTPDDPTPDDPTPDDPTPDDPTPDGTGDVTWQQGQEYTKESSKNIVFRVDYPMNKFVSLSIDNSSVDKKYYGITSGSTIVTIDHGYLDTLEVGEHTIGVIFADKTITTNFSIIKAEVLDDSTSDDEEDVLVPDTGMFTSGIGGAVATIAIVTFIGLSTAGIMHHIKKRKSEHFVFDK